jgi:hypothetical protein
VSDELEQDRDVEELVDAADAEARADLRTEPAPPPFAAVVARAHRIDPSAVRADNVGAVARHRQDARLVEDPVVDPTIDAWVAAARAEAEADAHRHLSRPRPPLRVRAPSAPRRWAIVGGGLLLAAVAVLALGLRPGMPAERDDDEAKTQALSAHERDDGPMPSAEIAPSDRQPQARASARRGTVREDAAIDVEAALPELDATTGNDPAASPAIVAPAVAEAPTTAEASRVSSRPATRVRGPRASPSRSDRLRDLDGQAQRLLASGRLDAADRTLAELVAVGGDDRLVEAAFGDRFAIAHREGAQARQRRLWAAYLQRFPRGRFADDARAGLCRAAADGASQQCWSAYARDFPRGTYRERAERALARSDPP